jgi:hypothetical protein
MNDDIRVHDIQIPYTWQIKKQDVMPSFDLHTYCDACDLNHFLQVSVAVTLKTRTWETRGSNLGQAEFDQSVQVGVRMRASNRLRKRPSKYAAAHISLVAMA